MTPKEYQQHIINQLVEIAKAWPTYSHSQTDGALQLIIVGYVEKILSEAETTNLVTMANSILPKDLLPVKLDIARSPETISFTRPTVTDTDILMNAETHSGYVRT